MDCIVEDYPAENPPQLECFDQPDRIASNLSPRLFWNRTVENAIHQQIFDQAIAQPLTLKILISDFAEELELWALCFWREILEAISYRLDDDLYHLKCLGAIVRRRAAIDPLWFFIATEKSPDDVMSLSEHIGSVRAYGVEFPAGSWREWIRIVVNHPHPLTGDLQRLEWDRWGRCQLKSLGDLPGSFNPSL